MTFSPASAERKGNIALLATQAVASSFPEESPAEKIWAERDHSCDLSDLRHGRALPLAPLGSQPGEAVQERELDGEADSRDPPTGPDRSSDRQADPAVVVRAGGREDPRPPRVAPGRRGDLLDALHLRAH